jgi:hypothetical protein
LKKLTRWVCMLLLAAMPAAPVFAATDDTKTKGSATDTTADDTKPAAVVADAKPSAGPTALNEKITALLATLEKKGVLAPAEANEIRNASPEEEFQLLVDALNKKGLIGAADLSPVASAATQPVTQPTASVAAPAVVSNVAATPAASSEMQVTSTPAATLQATAKAPSVVPAIAPVRTMPLDPPAKDGLVAAFKAGAVKITPYGFIKATAVHDSSAPNGDDFPFVGLFLSSTQITSTGPTADPEFHIKARSTRLGANFEWPDASPKLTFTGRVEGDYEGNFSEVDNRDVSSIRSNAFQLRLAYVRMDYGLSDRTDLFFQGGQDWTLFGSSLLPNILETTFLDAFYGTIYTRSPQMAVGVVEKLGGSRNFKFMPEFAIMMPSTGQIEKLGSLGLQGQIGQAEREGADSGRPEVEARAILQFQLDKAPGVAPAQLIWSGFYSRRKSIVSAANYGSPTASCLADPDDCAEYQAAFPNGFTASSKQYGDQIGFQLPTRWATLVASAYFGGDLRFFFGGQVNSYFTDTAGLINPISFQTLDGGPLTAAGAATIATNGVGAFVVAPQKPIRSFGGFVNLGLPLSRWFNADPKGHNGGWALYFHMGKDQVVHKDLLNAAGFNINSGNPANDVSPLPLRMGTTEAVTLYYKVNPWCSFAIEQSIYATRLAGVGPLANYSIAGATSNEWQDHRTEFGPVFTF